MKPNHFLKSFIFISGMVIIPLSGICQKWVADTITVGFGSYDKIENSSFSLVDVKDYRTTFPEYISVFEQKKWLFFPVDQIVKTNQPLSVNLKNKFHPGKQIAGTYSTSIYQFNIKNSKVLGRRTLSLFSTLELSEIDPTNDTILVGSFYYERTLPQKKKENIESGYEKLIEDWCKQFGDDIQSVQNGLDLARPGQMYYFRRGANAVGKNFYTSVDLFAGLHFWGIDGELWFSEPEGNRIFNRSAGVIRYLNFPDFQSIAVGGNVRRWNYRISDSWLFTHKMALLLGVNNWKDMKTTSHKLEEILLFDASMTQQINFNPLDKTGFVFGLGLMEDVHYIIYHKIKFNIGLSLNCAYKF
jgi:hypothetical protein